MEWRQGSDYSSNLFPMMATPRQCRIRAENDHILTWINQRKIEEVWQCFPKCIMKVVKVLIATMHNSEQQIDLKSFERLFID